MKRRIVFALISVLICVGAAVWLVPYTPMPAPICSFGSIRENHVDRLIEHKGKAKAVDNTGRHDDLGAPGEDVAEDRTRSGTLRQYRIIRTFSSCRKRLPQRPAAQGANIHQAADKAHQGRARPQGAGKSGNDRRNCHGVLHFGWKSEKGITLRNRAVCCLLRP